jgi:rRNA maturation endonuclease Nob1
MTSSIGWTKLTPRRVTVVGFLLATAVSAAAVFKIGRFGPSVVFIGLCTFLLTTTVALLLQVAGALLREPAEIETNVATGRRKKELEREKQSLVKALKELEFDHRMGKISEADWKEIGGQYRARALRALRQLDAEVADYRLMVEREVARRKSLTPTRQADEVRPRCIQCSTENDTDAAFCKRCGQRLSERARVAT